MTTHAFPSVNPGRQAELDLLKAATIVPMIFTHVVEVIFSNLWEDLYYCDFTLGWQIAFFTANATGPFGFMFAMGASIPYSRHTEPRLWIKRGLMLIAGWFTLNAFRTFPLALRFARQYEMSDAEFYLCYVFVSDILFFSGMFFIFFGALSYKNVKLPGIVLSAAALFIAGQFISYSGDSFNLHVMLGNFMVTSDASFPFLNWIMAPMLGVLWGKLLQRTGDKDRLYLRTGLAGAFCTGAILFVLSHKGLLSPENLEKSVDVTFLYLTNGYTLIVSCSLLAVALSLYYALTRLMPFKWFTGLYSFFSKNLTVIYVVQWLVIPWLALALPRPTQKTSPWHAVLIMCCVLSFSAVAALIYRKAIQRTKLMHGA